MVSVCAPQLKRVHGMRAALLLFDFDDESIISLKKLLLRCTPLISSKFAYNGPPIQLNEELITSAVFQLLKVPPHNKLWAKIIIPYDQKMILRYRIIKCIISRIYYTSPVTMSAVESKYYFVSNRIMRYNKPC